MVINSSVESNLTIVSIKVLFLSIYSKVVFPFFWEILKSILCKEDEIKIGVLLSKFLKNNNLEKGLEKVDAKDAWYKIMKNGVSNYTTDVHLKNKTLYVSLSSSTLREELSYGKEKIINLLNEALEKDAIKKIVLR